MVNSYANKSDQEFSTGTMKTFVNSELSANIISFIMVNSYHKTKYVHL